MSLAHLARAALSMPPRVVAAKLLRLADRKLRARLAGGRMRRRCTFTDPAEAGGSLVPRLPALDPALLAPHAGDLRELARRTCAHRFDLLGSGWVEVVRGNAYAGFGPWRYSPGEGPCADWRAGVAAEATPGNRARVAALLGMIDAPGWRPIDWHVDFRSGYRWPATVWGPASAYGHEPGVDVKLPWELARMQHLPPLALAFALDGDAALAAEFRNQVLDFLAANPPHWGVNWACAMDVAIRAVNLLLAWDLFRAHGARFDAAFEGELAAAALAHGRHVAAHLEWNEAHRGNHYLADVCGLAFIAGYLPRSAETDLWLAFAIQQLDAEILRQFGEDGANFEASTAYHRLSAEMALFTAAFVLGLPGERRAALREYDAARWRAHPPVKPAPMAWPPLGAPHLQRLARAARFAADVTKPSGEMVQVGDNDSGRFVKLAPRFDASFAEKGLDPTHLAEAARGLFGPGPVASVDAAVVAGLAGGLRLQAPPSEPARALAGEVAATPARRARRVTVLPADPAALDGLEPVAYPDFGLFIWRSARAFVSVRCGPIGGNGLGAHAHNDQLAVEIEIDGVAFARDPGTFVYTPDLKARNAYRSSLAHFVPRDGVQEPARLDLGPFRLEDRARARALCFDRHRFVGRHDGFGQPVWRRVRILDGGVVVEDCFGGPDIGAGTEIAEQVVRDPADLARLWGIEVAFSAGYGLPRP